MVKSRRRGEWLLVVVGLALGACGDEVAMYASMGPRYEARAWLAANTNPFPFASNRFESREAATAFVDSLYAMGADTVYVLNVLQEPDRIQEEGGPYADALLIRLPADAAYRARLFAVNAREAGREGFDPDPDRGQLYLFFWWD